MSTQQTQPTRPKKPPNPRTPITRPGTQPKFGGGNGGDEPPSIKEAHLDWKRKNRGIIQTPRPSQPGPGLFPPKGGNGGRTRRRKGRKSKRTKRSHKKTRRAHKKSKSHRKRR